MNNSIKEDKIILGIDPGTNIMGYALLAVKSGQLSLIQYGVLKLASYKDHHLKLQMIFKRTGDIIKEYKPDEMAIEAPFFGKNVQAMLKLGRAQGVAIAAALNRDIPVVEYAPKKIKQSVTGNGNASKEQVAKMIMIELRIIKQDDMYLDSTDAIAVAMCHYFQKGSNKRATKSWAEFAKENENRIKGNS